MAGFSRMHKEGRRARGRQCGSNLAAHMPALAHAHHHHAPLQREHTLHGIGKRLTNAVFQPQNRSGLDIQCFLRQRDSPL